MAKGGRQKNTVNKAKHSRLMQQKKNKLKSQDALRKERLRALYDATNENVSGSSDTPQLGTSEE